MEKILCVGEEWRGSNASGFFYALSRLGHYISILNELSHVSLRALEWNTKFLNRLIRPLQINDFNNQAIRLTNSFQPSMVLVYKGAFLKSETVRYWKSCGIPVVNFFPDVSFMAHGSHIPECIPLYDHIFTTKTFGAADLLKNFGVSASTISFVPHGFDPLIHRKMNSKDSPFLCDASFIGNYSSHKHAYLTELKRKVPHIKIKIWGETWSRFKNAELHGSIQSVSIEGDLYALALNSSKINIALLSEQVEGASRGDQITSRTFHIPGAGGFMLHQRTEEVKSYFKEDEEMVCFGSTDELVEKVIYYSKAEPERDKIRLKGYERARKEHSIDQRAHMVMKILEEKGIVINYGKKNSGGIQNHTV